MTPNQPMERMPPCRALRRRSLARYAAASSRRAAALAVRWSLSFVFVAVLSGCYPGLPVVQPKSRFTIVDAEGASVDNARVTVATYRWPFPRPTTTVLTTFQADENGELNLRARRKWQWQLLMPDGVTGFSWAYCVEKAGFRAVASPEVKERIGDVTVALEAATAASTCVWPDDDGDAYWQVRVQE